MADVFGGGRERVEDGGVDGFFRFDSKMAARMTSWMLSTTVPDGEKIEVRTLC